MEKSKKDEMTRMVGWYDPSQLKDTAIKTVISTVIGANADPRLVAATTTSGKFFDYSHELRKKDDDFETITGQEREEIWIDYAADVGDGFNSTYSVAHELAKPAVNVSNAAQPLKRGEILIFGGDGVYPTANQDAYEKKLIMPYRLAFKAGLAAQPATAPGKVSLTDEPHIFALPGNHDWYDSLVAFQNLFCSHFFNRRKFAEDPKTGKGGWRTRQEIGYFALKLPHEWWLLGIDFQLSHSIDVRQLRYFETIISQMEPDSRVILCVPEPYWVKAIKYDEMTDVFAKKEKSVESLENLLAEKNIEIKLYLAGDLHHYRRFVSVGGSGVHKITAGGGGAFLHPTHDFDFSSPTKGFSLEKNYPEPAESSKLDWGNFAFIFKNPTFGILTAAIYAVLAWMIHGVVDGEFTWKKAFDATIDRLINEPIALLIVVGMLLGLVFFTDSNSTIYRRTAGTIHGLAHLAAIFVFGWLGYLVGVWLTVKYHLVNLTYINLVWFFSVMAVSALGGYVVGSIIMGLYLFISLHIFKRHDNEAFSALKIEDYKNFLRLHIDAKGNLNVYPLKIEKVSREWNSVKVEDRIVSCEPKDEIKVELIESVDPIA